MFTTKIQYPDRTRIVTYWFGKRPYSGPAIVFRRRIPSKYVGGSVTFAGEASDFTVRFGLGFFISLAVLNVLPESWRMRWADRARRRASTPTSYDGSLAYRHDIGNGRTVGISIDDGIVWVEAWAGPDGSRRWAWDPLDWILGPRRSEWYEVASGIARVRWARPQRVIRLLSVNYTIEAVVDGRKRWPRGEMRGVTLDVSSESVAFWARFELDELPEVVRALALNPPASVLDIGYARLDELTEWIAALTVEHLEAGSKS